MAETYWKCKNSWGNWADEGYFRVHKKSKVKYIEVYYVQNDLTQEDWRNFEASKKKERQ
jgi:C1A family cysteine protease